jgi:maltose O-acetyltransferase
MASTDESLTWRDKMRAGQGFTPDDGFMRDIIAAQVKVRAFNDGPVEDFPGLIERLRGIVGHLGQNSIVLPRLSIDVGFNIEIGDNSFINQNATFLDSFPMKIGNDVQVGPNCAFYPVGHPLRVADRRITLPDGGHTHLTTGAPIVVEDQCWLGGNVVVMPGVTIGARSVIGAGSVVTKSIPPDVFAAGNPCRVIKPIDN